MLVDSSVVKLANLAIAGQALARERTYLYDCITKICKFVPSKCFTMDIPSLRSYYKSIVD